MSESPALNIWPCFVCCEDHHCDGEDGGGGTDDDPNGCYCPGCEFCRKEYDLGAWWTRELAIAAEDVAAAVDAKEDRLKGER
jgi:hypothetical protein